MTRMNQVNGQMGNSPMQRQVSGQMMPNGMNLQAFQAMQQQRQQQAQQQFVCVFWVEVEPLHAWGDSLPPLG